MLILVPTDTHHKHTHYKNNKTKNPRTKQMETEAASWYSVVTETVPCHTGDCLALPHTWFPWPPGDG